LSVWPEDDKSTGLKSLPAKKKVTLDIASNLAMFNGNTAHEVDDFEGTRFSVVYFTCGCHAKMDEEVRTGLAKMDFAAPKKSEDRYALLRAPAGYAGAGTTGKIPGKLNLRVWNLKKKKSGGRS
jgi:hypothetical protein